MKNQPKKILLNNKLRLFSVLAFITFIMVCGLAIVQKNNTPPTIKTETLQNEDTEVTIRSSSGRSVPQDNIQASPQEEITLESSQIAISKPAINAVSLEWSQEGEEGLELEVRTKRGDHWTPWVSGLQDEDRKDNTDSLTSTLVLAEKIEGFQYRFVVRGDSDSSSASLDLSKPKITTIDSNDGPREIKKDAGFLGKIKSFITPGKAHALADGPRIITRAEWGAPEPNNSPRWEPEYYPLGRAIVHHTVSTENPNALAAVRAIWQHHANRNGWGDIGYNYLVDSAGNIFQGRYFDTGYATRNSVEVEAGHTYGHNKGTIGIAAIGNFQTNLVPTPTLNSISNLIAFRFAPYKLNPAGNGPFNGPTVTGHRNHGSTACPGTNLYNQLPNLRVWAAEKAPRYASMHALDNAFVSQQLYVNGSNASSSTIVRPEDTVELAFNIRNGGLEKWTNTGNGAVRLGIRGDRISQLRDPSWLSRNRVTSFTGKLVKHENNSTSIEPAAEIGYGETAQFRFKVKVPEIAAAQSVTNKTLKEYFGLVIDGRTWFLRDMGLHYPLRVAAGTYTWQFQAQGVYTSAAATTPVNPSLLTRGQRYFVIVKAKNTGTATWRQTSMRLGTANPLDRSSALFDQQSWQGRNRTALLKETSVAPGAIGTFEFWITAPGTGFTANEYFRPVADGVAWLNDLGLYLPIRVIN